MCRHELYIPSHCGECPVHADKILMSPRRRAHSVLVDPRDVVISVCGPKARVNAYVAWSVRRGLLGDHTAQPVGDGRRSADVDYCSLKSYDAGNLRKSQYGEPLWSRTLRRRIFSPLITNETVRLWPPLHFVSVRRLTECLRRKSSASWTTR